jgi:hypothetical protein
VFAAAAATAAAVVESAWKLLDTPSYTVSVVGVGSDKD